MKSQRDRVPDERLARRAREFRELMQRRRSVRSFSDRAVPREVIEDCLLAAGAAPSGANMQPWHFVAVSDPEMKRSIRQMAEREEHRFYHGAAGREWLRALEPLGTDSSKPFLEDAPWLIVVFCRRWHFSGTEEGHGEKVHHFYVRESVGIAVALPDRRRERRRHSPAQRHGVEPRSSFAHS